MVWQIGDRVRLIRTNICGTMAEQPPNAGERPDIGLKPGRIEKGGQNRTTRVLERPPGPSRLKVQK